jgi:lysophospholipase L1-like esterase
MKKEILCYGDSNTWGWNAETKTRFGPEVRWPCVLQDTLGDGYCVTAEGLNCRTTVWDDPVEGENNGTSLNGGLYLTPCLNTHKPLDLLIIMLGTNDLKSRFAVSAYDIAHSIGALVAIARSCGCGRDDGDPEILIIAPPPLGTLSEYEELFIGGREKSRALASHMRAIADENACSFFDAGSVVQSCETDGVHLDAESHRTLGKAVAEIVRGIV